MNLKNIKTWVIATAFACMMGTLSHLSAVTTLTIGDSRTLGIIDPNHPASPTASAGFIDILLDPLQVPIPTLVPIQIGDNFYTRTSNDPLGGDYPDAVFADDLEGQFDDINLGTGFLYLLAKYDGPNFGSVVWYVGGLTGLVDIPSTGGGFGISNTYLFNGVPSNGVPDGGTTLMLLGSALAGLGALRRRFA
jgi:hypothetical protein